MCFTLQKVQDEVLKEYKKMKQVSRSSDVFQVLFFLLCMFANLARHIERLLNPTTCPLRKAPIIIVKIRKVIGFLSIQPARGFLFVYGATLAACQRPIDSCRATQCLTEFGQEKSWVATCHSYFILSDQTTAVSASMLTSGSSSFFLVFLCIFFRAVASHFRNGIH